MLPVLTMMYRGIVAREAFTTVAERATDVRLKMFPGAPKGSQDSQ